VGVKTKKSNKARNVSHLQIFRIQWLTPDGRNKMAILFSHFLMKKINSLKAIAKVKSKASGENKNVDWHETSVK
jgi:hypothetical protein